MENIREKIRANKLFSAMKDDEITKFLECAKPRLRSFRPRESIIGQGMPLKQLIIFLSGSAELYKGDYDGNRNLMGMLSLGDIYGLRTVFGDDNRSPFLVEAVNACRVMYIDQDLFYRPCSNVCLAHQHIIKNMLTLLANQSTLLHKKIDYLTIKNLRKKIARFLLEESENHQGADIFELPFGREALADYLNVQRPSLSREMIRMKRDGIIDFHRRTVRILDRDALRQ